MGKMNVVISDEIEAKFREAVAYYKGMKKGNISKALEEAINMWLDRQRFAIMPKRQYQQ
jgi:phage gp36-like protein